MWSKFLDTFNAILPQVYEFAKSIPDIFNRSLGAIIDDAPTVVGWILSLMPESWEQFSLLEVLTGALIPIAFLVFVVKLFIDW